MLNDANILQRDFLDAFEGLRDDLLVYLLKHKIKTNDAWKSFWHLEALIGRIRTGEENFRINSA